MGEQQQTTFPLQGIDLVTTGHQTQLGDCRLLENLVPTGRPDQRLWEVPKGTSVPTGAGGSAITGILSLGWQRRQKVGDAADTAGDPGQSLQRLVALRADGLYVIDPGQSYAEKPLWSFSSSDDSRRATFAQVGPSLFVAVTKGSGIGEPEVLLEVKDDTATPVQWPPLPILSAQEEYEADTGLSPGTVLFRAAWELKDGTVGPAGPPFMARQVGGIFDESWAARVQIERQRPVPDAWTPRLSTLVILAQVPVFEGIERSVQERAPRTTTQPINNAARIVKRLKDYDAGESFKMDLTEAEVIAQKTYEGTGLRAHQIEAGAVYSYNQRLILGDTTYQLHRPDLEQMLQWTGGTQNAGGDDYWLVLEVTVETQLGDVTVHSDPLPFDSTAITQVETRKSKDAAGYTQGYIYYPDARAKSWRFLVSTDYTGDFEAATWREATTPGSDRRFDEPTGGGFAYTDIAPGEPYDMTNRSGGPVDPLAHRRFEQGNYDGFIYAPTDDFRLEAALDTPGDTDRTVEESVAETIEFGQVDPTGTGAPQSVAFDYLLEVDQNNTDGSSSFEVSLDVRVKAADGAVLDSFSDSITGSNGNSQTSSSVTLSNFAPPEAEILEIKCEYDITISASSTAGAGINAIAQADNMSVDLDVTALTGDESLTRGAEDSNPNRLIWSQANTPLDLDVENVLFAGETPTDRILAMRATGQEVSSGQFGEYPIVLFGRESVRALQVGTDPFIQGVGVLAAGEGQGLVGRRATTTAKGKVVAVLNTGVYAFSPQQETPALSAPIHDPAEDVLSSMGPDTALAHYEDQRRFREELWVHAQALTWCFSISQGGWSTLARQRRDAALWRGRHAVRGDGTLVRDEQDTDAELDVRVQTALIEPGPLGTLGRMRQVHLRQPLSLTEAELVLVAADPKAEYVQLGSATLEGSSYNAGLPLRYGLAPGYVVDIRATAAPGQLIEAVMLDWEVRDRTLRDHLDHGIPAYDRQSKEKTQTKVALTSSTGTVLVLTSTSTA